jgi:hypothetical protein
MLTFVALDQGLEPYFLVVHEEAIALPHWPAPLDGFRIVALADLHVGAAGMGGDHLATVVDRTNALNPDLIVLAGDYVPGAKATSSDIQSIAKGMGRLRAKHGVFAVLGNHDWWTDGPGIEGALKAQGIIVLRNESVTITHGEGSFQLGGIDDDLTQHADIPHMMSGIGDRAPIVAVVHEPDVFPSMPSAVDLTIAGHTHGGQVRIPLLGALVVPSIYGQRYAAGVVNEAGHTMFITTGLGTSIMPVRFRVPPEIAVLTLTHRN